MQISTTKITTNEKPVPLLRIYFRDSEYISLVLSPTKAGETDEYECLLISIVNDGPHLSFTDISRIAEEHGATLTAEEIAYMSDFYPMPSYEQLVPMLIHARYSLDDEFAIQRKAIMGDTAEFEEYNAYVQSCKQTAQKVFERRTN